MSASESEKFRKFLEASRGRMEVHPMTALPVEDLTIPAEILKQCLVRTRRSKHGWILTLEFPARKLLSPEFRNRLVFLENQISDKPRLLPEPL
jgi:hypothetical protein